MEKFAFRALVVLVVAIHINKMDHLIITTFSQYQELATIGGHPTEASVFS